MQGLILALVLILEQWRQPPMQMQESGQMSRWDSKEIYSLDLEQEEYVLHSVGQTSSQVLIGLPGLTA